MGYDVVIVKPPVPDDDAAAWSLMRDLAAHPSPGEAPPVFHDLIDRLTARYPCLCALPDDQVDDGAWSDGPLRNNVGPAVTVLGLASPRVEEVQPFVVAVANALGLVVFDEQQGKIYRPGQPAPPGLQKPQTPAGRAWWKFWA